MAKPSADSIAYSAAALQAGDVQKALAVRNREFHQDEGSFDESVARTINFILTRRPQMLADCPTEIVEPLRVAAAMMELWGTNTIRDFVTIEGEIDYRLGARGIALMLHTHGDFLRQMEDLQEAGIKRVQILGTGDSDDCDDCRALADATFAIGDVPELPLATCRCETGYGCRLWIGATE